MVLAGSSKSSARISKTARREASSFLMATISLRADRKSRIKEEAAAVTVPMKAMTPTTLAAAEMGSISTMRIRIDVRFAPSQASMRGDLSLIVAFHCHVQGTLFTGFRDHKPKWPKVAIHKPSLGKAWKSLITK